MSFYIPFLLPKKPRSLSHFRLLVEEVFAPQSHIVGSGVYAGVWVRMKGLFLHFRSST